MKNIFLTIFLFLGVASANSDTYSSSTSHNNIAQHFTDIAAAIAKQLNENKNSYAIKDKTLAILSIVDINDYKQTSNLGRRVSENLIHEMQKYGYKIIEYKAMNSITIDDKGEYVFSRTMDDLKKEMQVTYALSGTYTRYDDSLTINCRIIDIATSLVVSTAHVSIPKSVLRKINKQEKKDDWFK